MLVIRECPENPNKRVGEIFNPINLKVMKRAKMALAVITFLAILGGVYATKAAKRGSTARCTTTSTGTPVLLMNKTVVLSMIPNTYCEIFAGQPLAYARTIDQQ
jgi:hypothetical protein